ncbi:hypothetical protein DM02DRAFT_305349 [Periconia macrospinosa]|uniref:Uncharacterized protein n=1 Tax=Periconia macrospinosa TaxID=97972 RepID=A0A2V1D1W3_9PLEO|nr:hypothetical protein DM02DRAFT_305349 [Periconia macrospinosa]
MADARCFPRMDINTILEHHSLAQPMEPKGLRKSSGCRSLTGPGGWQGYPRRAVTRVFWQRRASPGKRRPDEEMLEKKNMAAVGTRHVARWMTGRRRTKETWRTLAAKGVMSKCTFRYARGLSRAVLAQSPNAPKWSRPTGLPVSEIVSEDRSLNACLPALRCVTMVVWCAHRTIWSRCSVEVKRLRSDTRQTCDNPCQICQGHHLHSTSTKAIKWASFSESL